MPESQLVEINQDAINRVVELIVDAHNTHRLTFAYEVGAAIFQNIFEGDQAKVSGAGPNNPSFLGLTEDPRLVSLNLSKSTLHNFVRLHIQITTYMPEVAETLKKLSLSHQIRLLRVSDAAKKLEFAKMALDERLTVRGLEEQIKEARPQDARGRPQDHPVFGNIKILTRAAKGLRHVISSTAPLPARWARPSAEDIEAQRNALTDLKELITEAEEALGALGQGQSEGDDAE